MTFDSSKRRGNKVLLKKVEASKWHSHQLSGNLWSDPQDLKPGELRLTSPITDSGTE